ncbi:MAG: zinc-ribbon domain-containing protein [Paludibacteraceae bacterium]|jgi:hypothetical protein|nr:zinc-ribbon domain-containing protein [Paludibacteraceae bacterium]
MALVKCPECGKEVSSNAATCPNCGTPIKGANVIRVQFPKTDTILGCYVYDSKGNTLAKCNVGEIASFESAQPINIKVKMKGFFGSAEITAKPGGRYAVSTKWFGGISIKEVDSLTGGESTNNWH